MDSLARNLLLFLLLLISLTLHEWAHAFMADKLGDPNPRMEGRVTMNPLAHIDFFGTLVFPLLCIFLSTGILFGWGKPVNIHSSYFKHPKWGELMAGCAGIFGNLFLCLVCSFVLAFLPNLSMLASNLLFLNALLITFNCIPLPSLDGFSLAKCLFKFSEETIRFLEVWGFLILLLLINIPIFFHGIRYITELIFTIFFNLGTRLHMLFP